MTRNRNNFCITFSLSVFAPSSQVQICPARVAGRLSKGLCRRGACYSVAYCGPKCQKSHWRAQHKAECKDFAALKYHEITSCKEEENRASTLEEAHMLVGITWTLRKNKHGESLHAWALNHLIAFVLEDVGKKEKEMEMIGQHKGEVVLEYVDREADEDTDTNALSHTVAKLVFRALQELKWTTDMSRRSIQVFLFIVDYMVRHGDEEPCYPEVFDAVSDYLLMVEENPAHRGEVAHAMLLRAVMLGRRALDLKAGHPEWQVVMEDYRTMVEKTMRYFPQARDKKGLVGLLSIVALLQLGPLEMYAQQVQVMQAAMKYSQFETPHTRLYLICALIWQRRFSEAEKLLRPMARDQKSLPFDARAAAELWLAVIAWEKRKYADAIRCAIHVRELCSTSKDRIYYMLASYILYVARCYVCGEESIADSWKDVSQRKGYCEDMRHIRSLTSHMLDKQLEAITNCLVAEFVYLSHHDNPVNMWMGDETVINGMRRCDGEMTMLRECKARVNSEPVLKWSNHYHRARECIYKRLAECLRGQGKHEEVGHLEAEIQDKDAVCDDILRQLRPRHSRKFRGRHEAGEYDPSDLAKVANVESGSGANGIECYGCEEEYEETVTAECGHVFHVVCFDRWVDTCRQKSVGSTCPICRKELYV